jgi:hypothetical protein
MEIQVQRKLTDLVLDNSTDRILVESLMLLDPVGDSDDAMIELTFDGSGSGGGA